MKFHPLFLCAWFNSYPYTGGGEHALHLHK